MTTTKRVAQRVFLCVLLASLGCEDMCASEDLPSQASFVVVNPGSGPTNEEPLWTLKPGTRFGAKAPFVVLPAVNFRGQEVYPVARNDHGTSESRGVPSEPASWWYLSHDEQGGVVFHGQPREGRIEPALLVPSEVRVGMKWRTGHIDEGCSDVNNHPDCIDDPRFTITVLSRSVEDTLFGVRPVWLLEVRDWRGWQSSNREYPDANIFNGISFVLEFVEGRGPRVPLKEQGSLTEEQYAVYPLDDAPPEVALPALTLTPFPEIPDFENAMGLGATGYFDASHFDDVMVGLLNEFPSFGQSYIDFGDGTGATLELWSMAQGLQCAGPDAADDDDCRVGHSIAISSDGQQSQTIVLSSTGSPISSRPSPTPGNDAFPLAVFLGIFESPTGGDFEVLRRHRSGLERGMLNANLVLENGFDIPLAIAPLVDVYQSPPRHWPFRRRNRFAKPFVGGGYGAVIAAIDDDDPGVRVLSLNAVSSLTDSSFINFAHLNDDQSTSFEHQAYPQVGHFNVFSQPGTRRALLSTYAGRIEEVVLQRDGIALRPLGDVVLPPGEFMVGALKIDDELVVFTQAGYQGVDAFYVRNRIDCLACEGIDRATPPQLGRVRAWHATPQPGVLQKPAPLWSVEAKVTGLDVLVCWAPGHGPALTEGWTLGGHEPALVVVTGGEDRCVLVVRDAGQPDVLAKDSAWLVEGPLPDGTRVAIGTSFSGLQQGNDVDNEEIPSFARTQPTAFASMLYDSKQTFFQKGGVWPTTAARLLETLYGEFFARGDVNLDVVMEPDLSGKGGWILNMPSSFGNAVGRVFEDGRLLVLPYEATWGSPLHTLSAGGGLLFSNAHLDDEGRATLFPDAFRSLGPPLFRLANGTLCVRPTDDRQTLRPILTCVSQAGDEVNVLPPVHLRSLYPTTLSQPILSADGDVYFLYSSNLTSSIGLFSIVKLDAETLLLSEIDLKTWGFNSERVDVQMHFSVSIDDEGVPLAAFSLQEPTYVDHRLIRLEQGGPVVIERVELKAFAQIPQIIALKQQDVLLVAPFGGGTESLKSSSWFTTHTGLMRLPYNNGVSRPMAAADLADSSRADENVVTCLPRAEKNLFYIPQSEWLDEVTSLQASLLPRLDQGLSCPYLTLTTRGETRVRIEDENGAFVDVPPWRVRDCEPTPTDSCNGLASPNLERHYVDLEPFQVYTLHIDDGPMQPLRVATGNHGTFLSLTGDGTLTFPAPIKAPGPALTTENALDVISDPQRRQGLVHAVSGTHLLAFDDEGALQMTSLPPGGVFSPDGKWVFGSQTAFAFHIDSASFVPLPEGLIGTPAFSLPEHQMVFYGKDDDTGVVFRFDDAGSLSSVFSIRSDQAIFSGDGLSVLAYIRTNTQGAAAELQRIPLDDTPATSLISFANVTSNQVSNWHLSPSGDRAYAINTTTREIFFAEGEATMSFLPFDLAVGFLSAAGIAVGQREGGVLAVIEDELGAHKVLHYDPDNLTEPYRILPDLVLAPQLRAALPGVDVLLVLDGDNNGGTARLLRTSDGETLYEIENVKKMWRWPDGTFGIVQTNCTSSPGPSCRSLLRFSDDGAQLLETVATDGLGLSTNDKAQEYWPFGNNRNRNLSLDGVIDSSGALLFPGHPIAAPLGTLDLPCSPVLVPDLGLSLVYDGANRAPHQTLYCLP